MNTLFRNNYGRKIRKCDRNIHKAVLITVGIYIYKVFLQLNQKTHVNWNF